MDSTAFWTLVILTEQPFLSGRQFNLNLEPTFVAESRQRCVEASLKIWRLVEAYRETFTLRRAQYGISYSTYCAVLVLLQMSDASQHIECIRFFWAALWEYQRGCNYSLKRPLKLLKSLMHRLESAGQVLTDGQTGSGSQTSPESKSSHDRPAAIISNVILVTFPSSTSFDIEHDVFIHPPDDSLQNFLFDGIIDNGPLEDDTIFGMFM